MRDTPLSNCEREFIKQAVIQKKRIDGRQPFDYRKIRIKFGTERGSCYVELGQTRVFAKVSCELCAPKATRPSDGVLFINVELSPMACPSFEGRPSELSVEINRLLERCLKESRCVDMESLCIISGEKVWQVRTDIHVLNHDGNIIDCASIAAITALTHFRRPDVTVDGSNVIVHPLEEKDPIPLSVHHMPICVSFSFYEQGKFLLVDPTDKEEKVMDGKMVIGMNKHREICTLQVTGQMLLLKDQVLRCSNIAVVKVAETTDLIHKALDNDRQARVKGEKFGYTESVAMDTITTNEMEPEEVDMDEVEENVAASLKTIRESMTTVSSDSSDVEILDKEVGSIGEGGPSTWDLEEKELVEEQGHKVTGQRSNNKSKPDVVVLDSDSEEEDVIIMEGDQLHTKPKEPAFNTKKGSSTESTNLTQLQTKSKPKKRKGKPS
ncbi:exosome complex component RRP45-like [Ylistrum balloti]|uniref:exosome complex component RRP45-like n=1 Tax=Ylistrum balloti TaxID=509963 RepID=UPI002905AC92|nr:exosome complex component RRP45-like [Ylistrum balloti]